MATDLLTAVLLLTVFQHGTAVITLVSPHGIVMAADSITHYNAGATGPNEQKIAICGNGFLCGMGGYSPIDVAQDGHVLKYEFQSWIASIKVSSHSSVKEFASAVQLQAGETFRDMDFFLKEDDYWKAQSAPTEFMSYAIAGYSGDALEVCTVLLEINWDDRTLKHPSVDCVSPTFSSDTKFRFYPLRHTVHRHMDNIFIEGETPEKIAYNGFLSKNLAVANTLFSATPPSIHKLTAIAASCIQVEGKFSANLVGGNPLMGVIIKGQLPRIAIFATN